jgi:hypothetical protein
MAYNFYSNVSGVQPSQYGYNNWNPNASMASGLNFTQGGNSTQVYGYNPLNNYGMGSPTGGSGVPDLGGSLGSTQDLSGATSGPLAGSAAGTFGMNVPTAQLGLGALGMAGNMWGAFKAQGLAQSQFDFQKQMAQKNLANSIAAYNTQLDDKARARGAMEGQTDDQVNSYISKNKLSA